MLNFTRSNKNRLMIVCIIMAFFGCAANLQAKRPQPSKYFKDRSVADLVEAAASGNIIKIDEAIRSGVNVNARGIDGWSPLAYTMLSQNKEGFSALLARGADPNAEVAGLPGMSTSLMGLAAQADDDYWLTELIEHGGDVNVETSWGGVTPITIAILTSRLENVRLLVASGADLDVATEVLGDTPLLRAAMSGKWDSVLILLESGADWRKRIKSDKDIIDFLKASIERNAIDPKSPFWTARKKVVGWLMDQGAELPKSLIEQKQIRATADNSRPTEQDVP